MGCTRNDHSDPLPARTASEWIENPPPRSTRWRFGLVLGACNPSVRRSGRRSFGANAGNLITLG